MCTGTFVEEDTVIAYATDTGLKFCKGTEQGDSSLLEGEIQFQAAAIDSPQEETETSSTAQRGELPQNGCKNLECSPPPIPSTSGVSVPSTKQKKFNKKKNLKFDPLKHKAALTEVQELDTTAGADDGNTSPQRADQEIAAQPNDMHPQLNGISQADKDILSRLEVKAQPNDDYSLPPQPA